LDILFDNALFINMITPLDKLRYIVLILQLCHSSIMFRWWHTSVLWKPNHATVLWHPQVCFGHTKVMSYFNHTLFLYHPVLASVLWQSAHTLILWQSSSCFGLMIVPKNFNRTAVVLYFGFVTLKCAFVVALNFGLVGATQTLVLQWHFSLLHHRIILDCNSPNFCLFSLKFTELISALFVERRIHAYL